MPGLAAAAALKFGLLLCWLAAVSAASPRQPGVEGTATCGPAGQSSCAKEPPPASSCAPGSGDGAESDVLQRLPSNTSYEEALSLGIDSFEVEKPDRTCILGDLHDRADSEPLAACAAPGLVLRSSRAAAPELLAANAEGSLCAVSRRHRFIFVHVLKNGGSSTKNWLQAALCREQGEESCDICVLSFEQCYEAMEGNPGYFRFSWLRHPYDRAMSIYGMARATSRGEAMAKVSFAEFWLLGKARWEHTMLSIYHALPQAKSVATPNRCLAVDFLGSLERAEEDMGRVVKLLGVDKLSAHFARHGFAEPAQGRAFGNGAASIVEGNATLKAYLDVLYAADFALLHRCVVVEEEDEEEEVPPDV